MPLFVGTERDLLVESITMTLRVTWHPLQDLDFEFTNSLVNQQDFKEGRAEILIDEEGNSTVPAPVGIIDADDFMDEDVMQDVDAGEFMTMSQWSIIWHVIWLVTCDVL